MERVAWIHIHYHMEREIASGNLLCDTGSSGFPCGSAGKESTCSVRPGFNPWVGKVPWRRERLATPVFWPGEFHGLYSPWGRKESDTTERLTFTNLFSISSWKTTFGRKSAESISRPGASSFLAGSSYFFLMVKYILQTW